MPSQQELMAAAMSWGPRYVVIYVVEFFPRPWSGNTLNKVTVLPPCYLQLIPQLLVLQVRLIRECIDQFFRACFVVSDSGWIGIAFLVCSNIGEVQDNEDDDHNSETGKTHCHTSLITRCLRAQEGLRSYNVSDSIGGEEH